MKYILAYLLMTVPVAAQQQCGDVAGVSELLATRYGEQVAIIAVSDGAVFQIWGNPQSGTWTIVRLDPTGMACVMAYGGGGFETFPIGAPT